MSNSNFLDAAAVASYMGISVPTAYKIIRRLNDELKSAGYITISGKVNRRYFESKVFGMFEGAFAGGVANVGLQG